ncbi:MAG: Ldh family oxidoreductase, partial [Candidatus Cloacimonetes bacterium]|nr:Ldh family oxidoreductase [Candidatus Cloacimonadota bacterium]
GSYLNQLLGKDESGKPAPYRLGHFFLAINIDFFTDLDEFRKTSSAICRELQNSQLMPGRDRVWVAGEKEYEKELEIRRLGVPIIPNLQKDIETIQRELGLKALDI